MKHLKQILSILLIMAILFTGLSQSSMEILASSTDLSDVTVSLEGSSQGETEDGITQDSSEEPDLEDQKTDAEEDSAAKPEETGGQAEEGMEDAKGETEDTTEEEAGGSALLETTKETGMPYENCFYGDPFYSGMDAYGYDLDGKEIFKVYCNDLGEIIQMAEEGMNLSAFFSDTVFSGFTLEILRKMEEEGYTLDDASDLFFSGEELPQWLKEGFGEYLTEYEALSASMTMLLAEGEAGVSSLTACGVTTMSENRLGVIPALGGNRNQGPVYRLQTQGDDGKIYPAFCARYGGHFRTGYRYTPTTYSAIGFTNYQYNLIRTVINTYYKATGQQNRDFATAQIIIWYIINNMPDDSKYFDPDVAWNNGIREAAVRIGGSVYAEFIRLTVLSYSNYINQWWDAGHDDSALEKVHFNPDYYPGTFAELHFWISDVSDAQYIITWDLAPGGIVADNIEIPYINNYYLEKEAVTRYNVELTKESIITNELLEGFQFQVVESEASGYDLDYDIIKGTLSEYGNDYPEATTSTFGQTMSERDPVPYMDDDVEPSKGQHQIKLTTDENGYAETSFVHKHTFREFYSDCINGNNLPIDYETYQNIWEKALETAENAEASEAGSIIEVLYKGSICGMTYDQIKAIYDSQQIVYTQPQDEAQDTIDTQYAAYVARTYTYTVTELDTYTRTGAEDSNGNILPELGLPKDGYRKDVADTTTIGNYVEVVKNGGTMVAGGANDQDPNSSERNITNEPWQNQVFIHKTDLESNSQILYDTKFEIYEYYQYKVQLQAAEKRINVTDLLKEFETEQKIILDPDIIKKAVLKVENENGTLYLDQELDLLALKDAFGQNQPYEMGFTPSAAGTYRFVLELTFDISLSTNNLVTEVITSGKRKGPDDSLEGEPQNMFQLLKPVCKKLVLTEGSHEGSWNVDGGGTVTLGSTIETNSGTNTEEISGPLTYLYTDSSGNVLELSADENEASIDAQIDVAAGKAAYYFTYKVYEDSGYRFTASDGGSYTVTDAQGRICTYEISGDTYTISRHAGAYPENGTCRVEKVYSVSANDLYIKQIDKNTGSSKDDYTTWGQGNYEIVRVTPEIAKKMGWSDKTIGMYTVHRKSATDAYCGTTFTSAYDHATGSIFGYQEYGTLYYTQANLGLFAVVEKTAPSDRSRTGYLGNYNDRSYDYLDRDDTPSKDLQSGTIEQKNFEGLPYASADSMSTVKYVHYLDLCTDTNQYGTYMLVDGYEGYDKTYYARYVETLDDEEQTPTDDGYDAVYYDQSSLVETIALEHYKLENPLADILNRYWDTWFSRYLSDWSGISVVRSSNKTDTWFSLREAVGVLHHYVGTTINVDSFDNNDASKSDLAYDGTYTDTRLNYHSYAGAWAEMLNRRAGFHDVEYLQAGTITYDNGEAEKRQDTDTRRNSYRRNQAMPLLMNVSTAISAFQNMTWMRIGI